MTDCSSSPDDLRVEVVRPPGAEALRPPPAVTPRGWARCSSHTPRAPGSAPPAPRTASAIRASRPPISATSPAYRFKYLWGSGSDRMSRDRGRSGSDTGSSSPTMATSKAILSRSALPPTDVKTVARLTPAALAISSMDVAA